MKQVKVQVIAPHTHAAKVVFRLKQYVTAQNVLLLVWFVIGLTPLLLQVRSYLKFVIPHKITHSLVVPPGAQKETTNLTERCPAQGLLLASVWWNSEPTHYYETENGILCHAVVPQYNLHGNYLIRNSRATPYHTTPSSCAEDSFPVEQYLYHGSIGYYSFYEEHKGTYCTTDRTQYIQTVGLGSLDINGSFLADYVGSDEYKQSYWYGIVGAFWLVYRGLLLRRSWISCIRYGRRCDDMNEELHHHEAVVFVQESLRLSAHGATNYHRVALPYLLIEGVMSDLLLIIANDGLTTKIQYVSLGYNLSGLLLMMFEIVENSKWLQEKWRQRIKRLLFNYESSLVGELASAAGLQYFLTGLNGSSLKRSKPTALAVSYYFLSLMCHAIIVVVIFGTIISVRVLSALVYVWWRHRSWAIIGKVCCVDTAVGERGRMTMLGGYCLEDGKLYYKLEALRAFNLLSLVEDGAEFLVTHKLHWLTVPREKMFVIGRVSDNRVEPCTERPCTGIVSFFDRSLGGPCNENGSSHSLFSQRTNRVSAGPGSLNVLVLP